MALTQKIFGGTGGVRTLDQRIKSPLLYRLSYSPNLFSAELLCALFVLLIDETIVAHFFSCLQLFSTETYLSRVSESYLPLHTQA